MPEHKRVDEEGHTAHERYTDHDAWARLDKWASRYKIAWGFWLILLGVGSWVGSRVVQPLQVIPVVLAQQTAIVQRLDKGDVDRDDMRAILKVLIRMQCLQLDPIDRAKLAIDCRDIPLPQRGITP